jgi:hypothetical protein
LVNREFNGRRIAREIKNARAVGGGDG